MTQPEEGVTYAKKIDKAEARIDWSRPAEEIEKECVQLVRDKIGPVASFRLALIVPRLPKTRSGKILRGTIKKIADGEPWTMPATIEDPQVLDEIGSALQSRGVRN